MIQVEYVILIAIVSVVATLLIRFDRREKGQKTWREIHYANVRMPQIFVQQDVTPEAMKAAIEQYEYCVEMLKRQGNKYLNPDKDVHLFTWLADEKNTALDFEIWEISVKKACENIKEEFLKEHAKRAPNSAAAIREILGVPSPVEKPDFDDIKRNNSN